MHQHELWSRLQVYLTWSAGIPLMLIAWVATIYGLWQLIELHEIKGRRFNRYHELGQYALGEHVQLISMSCMISALRWFNSNDKSLNGNEAPQSLNLLKRED